MIHLTDLNRRVKTRRVGQNCRLSRNHNFLSTVYILRVDNPLISALKGKGPPPIYLTTPQRGRQIGGGPKFFGARSLFD